MDFLLINIIQWIIICILRYFKHMHFKGYLLCIKKKVVLLSLSLNFNKLNRKHYFETQHLKALKVLRVLCFNSKCKIIFETSFSIFKIDEEISIWIVDEYL